MAFWTQSSPNIFPRVVQIFLRQGTVIGIQNISGPYVNIIERCHQQGYPHSLLGHDTGISESCCGFCHMSPGYDPGLMTKNFPFDIKNHVTFHVLMIWWWCCTIWENVQGNTHIFHLQFDCVTPKGRTSALVDRESLFDSFGELNPKFVGQLVISSALALNQRDNLVSLLEDP